MTALEGKGIQFERAGAGTAICLTWRSVLLTVLFGERYYVAFGFLTALKIHRRVAGKKLFSNIRGRKNITFKTEEHLKMELGCAMGTL